jgi:hypothetical protein
MGQPQWASPNGPAVSARWLADSELLSPRCRAAFPAFEPRGFVKLLTLEALYKERAMNAPPPDPPTWQRISAALDQGLDLSADERRAWLNELEQIEPALANRLRELFAQHERLEDSGFLDSSPSDSPGLISLFSASLAGKQAGAYVI